MIVKPLLKVEVPEMPMCTKPLMLVAGKFVFSLRNTPPLKRKKNSLILSFEGKN